MTSGARLGDSLRVVVILDAAAAGARDLADVADAAAAGGATMLQVRGKDLPAVALADTVRRVLDRARGLPVLVNDRLDVALAISAAGCHLGQDDFPIAEARLLAPPNFILGGSAGNEEEARAAAAAGAHYLGIGPVNRTLNKPDAGAPIGIAGFSRILGAGRLPSVAIGGVGLGDVPGLIAAGADGIAVVAAVLGAPDPQAAARELREAVDAALGGAGRPE